MLTKSWARSPALLLVLAAAVGLSGCASFGKGKKKGPDSAYVERPVDQLYLAVRQSMLESAPLESDHFVSKEVEQPASLLRNGRAARS